MELLDFRQLVEMKGGTLEIVPFGNRVRIAVEIGAKHFERATDLSLTGLNRISRRCGELLGIELQPMTPSGCGVSHLYLSKLYEGNAEEVLEIALGDAERMKGLQCNGGFNDCTKEGLLEDLVRGRLCESYYARTRAEIDSFCELFESRGITYRWEGTRTAKVEEDVECCCEVEVVDLCLFIINQAWRPPVDCGMRGCVSDDAMDGLYELCRNIKIWMSRPKEDYSPSMYESFCWGGGNKPAAPGKIARVIFDDREKSLPEFIKDAKEKCVRDWDFAKKYKELQCSSLGAFVIGQMLRARGQIVATEDGQWRYMGAPAIE